jgi:predicted esterase
MVRLPQQMAETTVHQIETPTSGRLVVRAPASTPAAGLFVGFHGYAESAETQLQRLSAVTELENWCLLSVQALNRFYRGRSEETVASWMTRQDRDVMIAVNIGYVDRAVDWVRKQFKPPVAKTAKGDSPLTPAPALVYAGFSQGTAMAFRAAVRGRAAATGVIAVGGDVPPELLSDPDARFPATLLARGERDDWYTQAKLDADVEALTARGVRVTPYVFDGAHEWPSSMAPRIAEFVRSLTPSPGS